MGGDPTRRPQLRSPARGPATARDSRKDGTRSIETRSLGRVPIDPRPLREEDVDRDPFEQFTRWYDDAIAHHQPQPEAMVVATSTPDGVPSARVVLLRGVDARGFCFFTDYGSRKGHELAANPRAAIVFHWPEVLRQVRSTGTVERVSDAESDAYWYARPRASRISAWASNQSHRVERRAALEAQVDAVHARFGDGEVPRPAGWGGFRLVPDAIELWQHRDDRLHDRLVYERTGDGWRITRLQP
jgi:pyridoxamine 5'-phosphate oxidase